MDLIYLFKALMKRKWLILVGTLMAVAVAFLLTMKQEMLYKSTAQIATGFTSTEQVKLKDESFNIYEIDSKFSNVIESLKSPRVEHDFLQPPAARPAEPGKGIQALTEEQKGVSPSG